jgi:urease subunit gamma
MRGDALRIRADTVPLRGAAVDAAPDRRSDDPTIRRAEREPMDLSPRELDKLYVYQVAELARRRRDRGTKLNISEAQALVSEAILEAARDGRSVAECMELGKTVVGTGDCMPGVRERITLLQIEATFPDGTKLVSCHDPIGG